MLLIIPQILYNAVVRPIVEQDPLQYDFFALLTIFRSTAWAILYSRKFCSEYLV